MEVQYLCVGVKVQEAASVYRVWYNRGLYTRAPRPYLSCCLLRIRRAPAAAAPSTVKFKMSKTLPTRIIEGYPEHIYRYYVLLVTIPLYGCEIMTTRQIFVSRLLCNTVYATD